MTDLTFPAPAPAQRQPPWGMAASVGLHAGLAAAVLLLSPLRVLVVPPPEPIAVEIVTTEEFAALDRPTAAAPPAERVPDPPAEAPAVAGPGERLVPSEPLEPSPPERQTVTATEFYSADLLRRPDMQRIRRTLSGFADSERIVQVCNIEAIEQIKRGAPGYEPDTVVAYAMADPFWNGLLFTAPGGAFRSRRKWYAVAFHCRVAPGYEGVTAFDFTIGAPIPQAAWEEHNLNAEDASDD